MAQRLAIKSTGAHPAVVTAAHFKPHRARMIEVVLAEAPPMVAGIVTITCGSDSHATGKHPEDDAFDFRGKNIEGANLEARRAMGQAWAKRVADRLGSDYDVIFEEHEDSDRDHLHVEFDPD